MESNGIWGVEFAGAQRRQVLESGGIVGFQGVEFGGILDSRGWNLVARWVKNQWNLDSRGGIPGAWWVKIPWNLVESGGIRQDRVGHFTHAPALANR
jgi:hypothetical protein